MELLQVLQHHLNGGRFEYLSYDHALAKEHFLRTDEGEKLNQLDCLFNEYPAFDKWDIPKEIRDQYSYWRNGKLRSIQFNPDGSILRVYIGAKRARTFYKCDLHELKLILQPGK